MEPGQNIPTPENVVTTNAAETPIVAELAPSLPQAQPIVQAQDAQAAAPVVAVVEPTVEAAIPAAEVRDLTDSTVDKADKNWVGEVRDLMREDAGKPYKEEEDAEELNEKYMKSRFNIDVDAPIEEK